MQIKSIETNKILPYINNPRKNLNIDKVASSIKEFGFQQPIVIDKNNTIIVGHTRFEAAKKLGLKEVPVQIADLTETQAKAYRIADNRLNEDASWDTKLLNLEFNDLLSKEFDLDLLGFTTDEVDNLFFLAAFNIFLAIAGSRLSNEETPFFKLRNFLRNSFPALVLPTRSKFISPEVP